MKRLERVPASGAEFRQKDKNLPKIGTRSAPSPEKPRSPPELQQLVGNRSTQRLLMEATAVQRATGDGHDLMQKRYAVSYGRKTRLRSCRLPPQR